MAYVVSEILFDRESLRRRTAELAREIDRDLAGRPAVAVGVLKGSVFFLCDLAREMSAPLVIDFVQASSYGSGTSSSGNVRLVRDLTIDVAGRNVLVVEDIVDSGRTLSRILDLLRSRGPAWLRVCALLRKPARAVADIAVDYVGFDIDDRFVVGYGLDYDEAFRNLPHVAVLSDDGTGKELK